MTLSGMCDVVCTRKDENLHAVKLLVLQPIGADGADVGRTLVAVDSVGLGVAVGDGGGAHAVKDPAQKLDEWEIVGDELEPAAARR